jgi:hypothetical protein
MDTTNTAPKLARLLTSLQRFKNSGITSTATAALLGSKGRLRRWSARNTVPGLIAFAATESVIVEGISWPAVALSSVAVLPLLLSIIRQKKDPNS